jgi:hypothetical protein
MIEINLPDSISRRAELVEEPRTERGGGSLFTTPVSWIELSEAASVTLSSTMDVHDKELANFLSADHGKFRYDYIRLGCTFHPEKSERFEQAWLKVTLTENGQPSSSKPIAWSLYPVEGHDRSEQKMQVKVGSKFEVVSAEVGYSAQSATKLYFLRAFKEGSSDPFWELTSTPATSLEGIFRFHLVVRSEASGSVKGSVRLETVISNRSFVVFRSKRPFDHTPSQEFQL